MAKNEEKVLIEVPSMNIKRAVVKIVGDSPLIINKFSEKARREILDKQMQKAKTPKTAKIPFADFMNSLHWITEMPDIEGIEDEEELKKIFEKAINEGAKFGFPAVGIKQSAISGAYRGGISKNKVSLQGAFHILQELVEIKGNLKMRTDMVRIPATGGADVVFRGLFETGWTAEFELQYDANVISISQIIQLINIGGFNVGIGDWRIEKGGIFGTFHCE